MWTLSRGAIQIADQLQGPTTFEGVEEYGRRDRVLPREDDAPGGVLGGAHQVGRRKAGRCRGDLLPGDAAGLEPGQASADRLDDRVRIGKLIAEDQVEPAQDRRIQQFRHIGRRDDD